MLADGLRKELFFLCFESYNMTHIILVIYEKNWQLTFGNNFFGMQFLSKILISIKDL